MALYRVLKDLSTGHKRGDVVEGSQFKMLDLLVAKNALAPISTPPLAELPGWTKRLEKMQELGIVTVQDLLDADSEAVARVFGYKSTAGIERWKKEATEWLKPVTVKQLGG
jgi:hypothetical protein